MLPVLSNGLDQQQEMTSEIIISEWHISMPAQVQEKKANKPKTWIEVATCQLYLPNKLYNIQYKTLT